MNPLKLAVIGLGNFGQLHARTAAALAEAQLVAIGDQAAGKAESLAAELGVPHVFSTLDELVEKKIAEALIVATRTDTHVSIAKAALKAGLHVLVEKPVGATLAEMEGLEASSRQTNRVAMAGHLCMFHSQISPLVERVRRDGFRTAHFVRHRTLTMARFYPEEHPIRMTMVHDLYVLGQMVNNEEPEMLDGLDAVGPLGHPDLAWATFRWKDGRVATLHSHWVLPAGAPADGWDQVEVFGNAWHARVTTNPQSTTWTQEKTIWPLGLEISTIDGRPTGMLAEELRSFIAACQGGETPRGCRVQDAVQIQRWIEQLLQSAHARRACNSPGK